MVGHDVWYHRAGRRVAVHGMRCCLCLRLATSCIWIEGLAHTRDANNDSWITRFASSLLPQKVIAPPPGVVPLCSEMRLTRCPRKEHRPTRMIVHGCNGLDGLGRLPLTLDMLKQTHLWDSNHQTGFCNIRIVADDQPNCASTNFGYSTLLNDPSCHALAMPSQIMSAHLERGHLAGDYLRDPKYGGDYDAVCEAMWNASLFAPRTNKLGWAGKCGHKQLSTRHVFKTMGEQYPNLTDFRCPYSKMTLVGMVQEWKYLLDVEGTGSGYSGRLPMLLRSGRLVFYVERRIQQWFMPLFTAWEHYVPISRNGADLVKNLEWVNAHPEAALQMARAGAERANIVLTQNAAIQYTNGLFASAWVKNFQCKQDMFDLCEQEIISNAQVQISKQTGQIEIFDLLAHTSNVYVLNQTRLP